MKKKRHYRVILTPEAVALREIRKKSGLSIREVCRRLGKSESFLRHIETGRNDIPERKVLNNFFSIYGSTYKIFRHKVNEVRESQLLMTPREEIKGLIDKIPDEKLETIRTILSSLT